MERKYLELFKDGFDATIAEKTRVENRPYVGYSITNGDIVYTIIPGNEDDTYFVYSTASKPLPEVQYEEVDLGLSVKWANCNLGATTPEEYGTYFAWGETEGVTHIGVKTMTAEEFARAFNLFLNAYGYVDYEVTVDNLKSTLELFGQNNYAINFGLGVLKDKEFSWEDYKFRVSGNFDYKNAGALQSVKLSKYCSYSQYGEIDNLDTLQPSDDAATVNIGNGWRTPTKAELEELFQLPFEKTTVNNIRGLRFTAANGNSIFLPCGGWGNLFILDEVGDSAYYWTSSLKAEKGITAHCLYGHNDTIGAALMFYGMLIRPVKD